MDRFKHFKESLKKSLKESLNGDNFLTRYKPFRGFFIVEVIWIAFLVYFINTSLKDGKDFVWFYLVLLCFNVGLVAYSLGYANGGQSAYRAYKRVLSIYDDKER